MRRRAKTLVTIAVIVLVLAFSFYSLTGFYVMPPKDSPPSGQTVWYYRRGAALPFLSSPDGQRQRLAREPNNPFIPLAPKADRIIARFAYNRALYLRTTGGIEFLE